MPQGPTAEPEKLSRDDLVALVRKIMNVEGSEKEIGHWLDVLEANFEHPAPSDPIYYPDEVPGFGHPDPTPEQVVEFGLAYRRRMLPAEELARLVDAYMHPRRPADDGQEAYYLIAENLRGYEINHLCLWARRRGLGARELVDRVRADRVRSDPDFQRSLADTYDDEAE